MSTASPSKPSVVIYLTGLCPYCVRAKQLLDRKGVSYEQIRVDLDRAQLRIMLDRSKRHTVPQIFIGEHHIGGYDDIAALERNDELDGLLGL